MFILHQQLQQDTFKIGHFVLSEILLINNASLPWVILVPRRENILEWHHLKPSEQLQLHKESMLISSLLMSTFNGDKLNIGALGNLVPQLHLHHVVRFKEDPVWPEPVWGKLAPNPYYKQQANRIIEQIQTGLLSQTELSFKRA